MASFNTSQPFISYTYDNGGNLIKKVREYTTEAPEPEPTPEPEPEPTPVPEPEPEPDPTPTPTPTPTPEPTPKPSREPIPINPPVTPTPSIMSLGDSDTAVNSSDRVTVQEETLYTYGDAEWGDLLTAYDGEEITYDGIGNPLSYRGWTMSWQGGRQLAGMTKGSDTLSFAYNESGLRTSKTVNGVTHNYVWQGSKLAADITDVYALYFHYDSSGEVIGFTRTSNGTDTEYFYVKNLQGDILKVITATGTEAATYTYDAWGKLLTSTGDMADVNPLRYRGYFYDAETGLYYLQSRYYDPEVSRFINPDVFATSDIDGVLAANMFAYCENNPIRNTDSTGTIGADTLIGAATGAITSLISGIASGDRGKDLILDVALGAAAGATKGMISTIISAAAAVNDAYKCYRDGVSIEGCVIVFASEFAVSFVSGGRFNKGFFGKGIWDELGKAAFDLSVGFAVNLTASQISTNVAENLYMTEPSREDKTSNQPVGNLAYIEPLQVMHYGGGTWRMATR